MADFIYNIFFQHNLFLVPQEPANSQPRQENRESAPQKFLWGGIFSTVSGALLFRRVVTLCGSSLEEIAEG